MNKDSQSCKQRRRLHRSNGQCRSVTWVPGQCVLPK